MDKLSVLSLYRAELVSPNDAFQVCLAIKLIEAQPNKKKKIEIKHNIDQKLLILYKFKIS